MAPEIKLMEESGQWRKEDLTSCPELQPSTSNYVSNFLSQQHWTCDCTCMLVKSLLVIVVLLSVAAVYIAAHCKSGNVKSPESAAWRKELKCESYDISELRLSTIPPGLSHWWVLSEWWFSDHSQRLQSGLCLKLHMCSCIKQSLSSIVGWAEQDVCLLPAIWGKMTVAGILWYETVDQ